MKMPLLFAGHGSPMNAIETNSFTKTWRDLGRRIPRPEAILSVSAHWVTRGSRTSDEENPRIVYDMFGFPRELYEKKYPAKGAPSIAGRLAELLPDQVINDSDWGIDHGTWSVLCHMFPKADIPVIQLSLDQNLTAREHFDLGHRISPLREEGVLILGSGNIVHNLALVDWNKGDGYPWAYEFDEYIEKNILEGRYEKVIHYPDAGESQKKSFYTTEHFLPLLYVLGAAGKEDTIQVFNKECLMGSISMTGYLFSSGV